MSQWQQLGYAGAQAYTSVGAGGLGMSVRDHLDARRSMIGSTPESDYPAGYLGTIQSRREDRLLNAVKQKLGDRSYQRGVHVGTKIDPHHYVWPVDQQPDRGLENIARGVKTAPTGTLVERLTMGGMPSGAVVQATGPMAVINPTRAAELRRLAPSWR